MTALVQRAETGKLPSKIDQIKGAKPDPFTGKPLLLKQSGDTIRIYSVGPNGKDDGGVDRSEVSGNESSNWDVVACFPPIKPKKQAKTP